MTKDSLDEKSNLHRRSICLRGYDYSQAGAYFVTICTHKGECLLGSVTDGGALQSEYGQIVIDCWQDLPPNFELVDPDAFVVMPNHFHGIVFIVQRGQSRGLWVLSCRTSSRYQRAESMRCGERREPRSGSATTTSTWCAVMKI